MTINSQEEELYLDKDSSKRIYTYVNPEILNNMMFLFTSAYAFRSLELFDIALKEAKLLRKPLEDIIAQEHVYSVEIARRESVRYES